MHEATFGAKMGNKSNRSSLNGSQPVFLQNKMAKLRQSVPAAPNDAYSQGHLVVNSFNKTQCLDVMKPATRHTKISSYEQLPGDLSSKLLTNKKTNKRIETPASTCFESNRASKEGNLNSLGALQNNLVLQSSSGLSDR